MGRAWPGGGPEPENSCYGLESRGLLGWGSCGAFSGWVWWVPWVPRRLGVCGDGGLGVLVSFLSPDLCGPVGSQPPGPRVSLGLKSGVLKPPGVLKSGDLRTSLGWVSVGLGWGSSELSELGPCSPQRFLHLSSLWGPRRPPWQPHGFPRPAPPPSRPALPPSGATLLWTHEGLQAPCTDFPSRKPQLRAPLAVPGAHL